MMSEATTPSAGPKMGRTGTEHGWNSCSLANPRKPKANQNEHQQGLELYLHGSDEESRQEQAPSHCMHGSSHEAWQVTAGVEASCVGASNSRAGGTGTTQRGTAPSPSGRRSDRPPPCKSGRPRSGTAASATACRSRPCRAPSSALGPWRSCRCPLPALP